MVFFALLNLNHKIVISRYTYLPPLVVTPTYYPSHTRTYYPCDYTYLLPLT